MKHALILCFFLCAPVLGQTNTGELRLTILDPSSHGVQSSVELTCEANQLQQTYASDDFGHITAKSLPFGIYVLRIARPGFAPYGSTIEIRSVVPKELTVQLRLHTENVTIEVSDDETLVDPYRTGTTYRIGTAEIKNRVGSVPGRAVVDLINSEPGWLYEGNSVLHPRGSEHDTQFVVNGVPLLDNRSPSFGPEIDADDIQSMNVFTANYPAEYGRKMGGVVEVETARSTLPGFHGTLITSSGSYSSFDGYFLSQYARGKNTLTASIDGAATHHYLNPPVVQNYRNAGTTTNYSIRYERDLTDKDRLSFITRHAKVSFEVPNEQVQQAAGQRQNRTILETMGIASYQHIVSNDVLVDVRTMARGCSTSLTSNPASTPIVASQDRSLAEAYVKSAVSVHQRRNEWKVGFEVDSTHLRENFSYYITDLSQFDPGTSPSSPLFRQQKWDLEQSAFVQDQVRLGLWTLSLGVRWDHYQLLVNQNAFSPRLGVSRYFQHQNLVLHAAYDKVFQTPSFENILLSSSSNVSVVNSKNFLQIPVRPSLGNFFEIGATKSFFNHLKLTVNAFDRRLTNYADDHQLLNTAISFPIAFAKGNIYGGEAKVEVPRWGRLNGFISYSYMVASAYFPVTGGLFLGQDVPSTLATGSRFWASQDQRNTVHGRFICQMTTRLWSGIGGDFGSGLPVEFNGNLQDAIQQYGREVVDRVDLGHGRVRQSLAITASLGADIWRGEKLNVRLQADGSDLNNRLNVINFSGLFSGNAIAPQRSYAIRLTSTF